MENVQSFSYDSSHHDDRGGHVTYYSHFRWIGSSCSEMGKSRSGHYISHRFHSIGMQFDCRYCEYTKQIGFADEVESANVDCLVHHYRRGQARTYF